ncbi:hypothetical protein [Pseudarthrobacter sp. ATCC 49987]|uniref:hypothetical protein n=1 Tax=Pseudarthrobacter sp. ATCC 49987 TaxID=2698204 RepID=UPI001367E69C|nr:hypothetical protein [Pseudarthrobacter sp. ATCC 49987]
MSAATTRPTVGALLATEAELNALPEGAVVLADPEGQHERDYRRRMPMVKLDYDYQGDPFWAVPHHEGDITSMEAVRRYSMGPFLLLWLPATEPAVEAVA